MMRWDVVDMHEPVEHVLGCWVLPAGWGIPRWSCSIEVLGNKWYLLYSWVDGDSGAMQTVGIL